CVLCAPFVPFVVKNRFLVLSCGKSNSLSKPSDRSFLFVEYLHIVKCILLLCISEYEFNIKKKQFSCAEIKKKY
ncbi:MAG: hypothetical protein LC105_08375, partial [Chitinophagales bacterium]|nr:hypothetical protein [Chitinophagales bacterium]